MEVAYDAYIRDIFWLYSATDTSRHCRQESHRYFLLDVLCAVASLYGVDFLCGHKVLPDEAQPETKLLKRI